MKENSSRVKNFECRNKDLAGKRNHWMMKIKCNSLERDSTSHRFSTCLHHISHNTKNVLEDFNFCVILLRCVYIIITWIFFFDLLHPTKHLQGKYKNRNMYTEIQEIKYHPKWAIKGDVEAIKCRDSQMGQIILKLFTLF